MEEAQFETIKAALDGELDALPKGTDVGIMLDWDLFLEFKGRDLLKQKKVDFVLWKWEQPSYRDRYVVLSDNSAGTGFRVGKPDKS